MLRHSRWVRVFHGRTFRVEPGWRGRLAAEGIAADRDWTLAEGGPLLSASPATKCYRVTLADGEVVYFKRYVYPVKYWLEFWMRAGKAAVEDWAYHRLAEIGVPSLQVLAFAERRLFGMLTATCIVTREIPDAVDLQVFMRDVWSALDPGQQRRVYDEIAGQLVEQMRRAHRAGFFHHDIKWRNILIQRSSGGALRPVWIDAPRASAMPLRHARGRMVDLSALARASVGVLSAYDHMRFLCRYLGPERRPGEAARLYRKVAAHIARRPVKGMDAAATLQRHRPAG